MSLISSTDRHFIRPTGPGKVSPGCYAPFTQDLDKARGNISALHSKVENTTSCSHERLTAIFFLRRYYNKVLKDKTKETGHVPLCIEELRYGEVLTLACLLSFYLSVSAPNRSKHLRLYSTELYGLGNKVRLFFILQHSLNQVVRVATSSRSSSNSRICTHPRGLHPTSCASPFRSHAAQRQHACLCAPLVVNTKQGA